ncbi:MAG: tol-pal system protein YbgF [Kiloniellales bacterium]
MTAAKSLSLSWRAARCAGRSGATVPRALRSAALLTGLLAVLLASGMAVPAARAQDQALVDRLNRMQQELITLQRHVYGSGSPAGAAATEALDESGRPLLARLELRMNQLEDEMRRLTGRIEEVSFQINKVGQRLDTLVADVDQRLQRLEQGAPGGPAAAEQQLSMQPGAQQPLGGAPQSGQPAQGGQAAGSATGSTFDSGPKVLGAVPASDLEAMRQQAQQQGGAAASGQPAPAQAAPAQQTAALTAGTAKEHYDQAFALLSQANYPAAEQALTSFLERYPDDSLAGNAQYWLGETYYVRGQFRDAAVTFAEGFQKFPQSSKAPDNLLKLGKSLAALGQTADACGTLAELKKRYPDAPATIHQQANSEQQRLSCQ